MNCDFKLQHSFKNGSGQNDQNWGVKCIILRLESLRMLIMKLFRFCFLRIAFSIHLKFRIQPDIFHNF
jgi:hypothetical protein